VGAVNSGVSLALGRAYRLGGRRSPFSAAKVRESDGGFDGSAEKSSSRRVGGYGSGRQAKRKQRQTVREEYR
jgi:hypothetical protein